MLHAVDYIVVVVVDLVPLLHFLASIHYTYLFTASNYEHFVFVAAVAGYCISLYFVVGIVSILRKLMKNVHSAYCPFYYPLSCLLGFFHHSMHIYDLPYPISVELFPNLNIIVN